MAKLTRDAVIKKVFSDTKHYPYGFSRSGDFSINESRALSQYGCLIAALVDGVLEPQCEQERTYIAVANGEIQPSSTEERAWVKYQTRINRPKMGSIYGARKADLGDDSEAENTDNSDLEIELDD